MTHTYIYHGCVCDAQGREPEATRPIAARTSAPGPRSVSHTGYCGADPRSTERAHIHITQQRRECTLVDFMYR